MKNLIDVLYKIDRGIWMIDGKYLHNMRELVVSHLSAGSTIFVDAEGDDDQEKFQIEAPGFVEVGINGPLMCNPNAFERLLGACDTNEVYAAVQAAGSDPSVDKILLSINSPGGEVTGIEELGNLVAEVAQTKTVVAYVDGMAASAAYWIASQANSIVTTKSGQLGSVGVYCLLVDTSEMLKEAGVKVNAIVSKNSPMKLAGAQWKPLTDEERAMFQASVEKTDSKFRAAILSNRKIKNSDMDGRVFDGEEAAQLGYADAIVKDKSEIYQQMLV